MKKIFISYRRTDPDQRLAQTLVKEWENQGHSVFWTIESWWKKMRRRDRSEK